MIRSNLNLNLELWILGDLNIDYLARDNQDTKRYLECFKTNGIKQNIVDITRPFRNGGTCIYWIATSSPFIQTSGVCNQLISDHFPVYCVCKKRREHHRSSYVEARGYKNYSIPNLRNLLLGLDWTIFDVSEDPNIMYDYILTKLYEILQVMCPLRRYKQHSDPARWITADIYRAIRYRKFYVTLFKLTRKNEHLKLAHVWRNRVNTMIDNAKSAFIRNELNRNVKNPKKFWRIINRFLDNRSNNAGDVIFIDTATGESIPKGAEANFLNDFFVNISTRLGLCPDAVFDEALVPDYDVIDNLRLKDSNVNIREIEVLARSIDISKASCIKDINSRVCKDVLTIIPDKFCQLFNISLKNGIFPRSWATGTVNVIPKSGDLSNAGNWRPITQTNIYAKVLEKIVHKRVLSHLLDNHILSEYQFGFLPGKSTQLAVFDLVKHIYSALNNKKIFGAACLDISKAFDCIHHKLLLHKLKKMGLSDMSLVWFESYLTRTQQLIYDGITSDCIPVRSGIGQGTIVGPIIFLLYMNDITAVLPDVHINMYADDCVLYSSANKWTHLRTCLQSSLGNFDTWCKNNNMVLNVSKSKCLIIGSRHKLRTVDYAVKLNVSDILLEYVKKCCYLGIGLDSEMILSPLVSHVKKVVSNKVKTLYKIRRYITTKCVLAIYKQTILPLFDYAGFLLISCDKSDHNDLQVIQNNILRCCNNVRLLDRLTLVDMHRDASLVSLEQRRKLQLLGLMYIYKNCRNVERIFPRNTRQGERYHFRTDNYQSGKYKSSPYFKGTLLWDSLAVDVITQPTLLEFKRTIKIHFSPFNETLLSVEFEMMPHLM